MSVGNRSATGPVRVFVISPIGDEGTDVRERADQVLNYIIRKALPEPEFAVARADESDDPGLITTDVINQIQEADLVIADLSGRNPNVFYELAVAHGFQIPTVHIAETGTEIPFDVQAKRAVPYRLDSPQFVFEAIEALARVSRRAMEGQNVAQNPIEAAGQFKAAATSDNPQDTMLASIMAEVRSIARRVDDSPYAHSTAIKDAIRLTDLLASYASGRRDLHLLDMLISFTPADPMLRDYWESMRRHLIDDMESGEMTAPTSARRPLNPEGRRESASSASKSQSRLLDEARARRVRERQAEADASLITRKERQPGNAFGAENPTASKGPRPH